MKQLVICRHGESQWNFENKFTGWVDVPLTQKGIKEAKECGKILKKNEFFFDIAYTSLLERANITLEYCLKEIGLDNIITKKDWRLNERHYGSLQGMDKIKTVKKYGKKQVMAWRRSFKSPPPPISKKKLYENPTGRPESVVTGG